LSLQSSPACTATEVVDTQLAAVCPSPSSSFATYSQTPWRTLHLPVAQLAGVVGGTVAAHSASVVQALVEVVASAPEPPSEGEVPSLLPPLLLQELAFKATAITVAPVIENHLLNFMRPRSLFERTIACFDRGVVRTSVSFATGTNGYGHVRAIPRGGSP
jgi:hypothetical protein